MKTLGEASTPAEVRAEAALTAVAAWTGRQIGFTSATLGIASPSHRGVDSEAWLVAVDQPSPAYFLKIVNSDQKAFVDLEAVFEAASIAAGLGCTPTPRHLARDADAIVFDLLPPGWKTARMDDLRRADVMERVSRLKRRSTGRGHSLCPGRYSTGSGCWTTPAKPLTSTTRTIFGGCSTASARSSARSRLRVTMSGRATPTASPPTS
ncbi:hypothetical protein [Mesorhizobium sp.]|uniref:hypothetical protein n=1 Tax=Mesorhizobium sp. TaxID=1871066 RepID=UPI00257E953F|nr:hypothetical protein [Mesorhizobium sp.]